MLWVVFINGFFEGWFLVSARAERIVNQALTWPAEFSLIGGFKTINENGPKKAGPGLKTWSGIVQRYKLEAQNSNFKANWISRACALPMVLVTTPKLGLLAVQHVPFGGPNWGWLKRLKNSVRNSMFALSAIDVFLKIAKSKLLMPCCRRL